MIMDPNFIVKVLLSLIVAAALAFAVTPLVKRLAQRVGAMDVPKDERRMHKIPIPRMGGLAIFFAFLIAVLCFAGIDRELRGILLGATIIVVLAYPIDWERLYLKKSKTAQRHSKPRMTRSIIDNKWTTQGQPVTD